MTLAQIEKTREFLSKLNEVNDLRSMELFSSDIIAFYGNAFNLRLKVKMWNTIDSYKTSYLENDKHTINSFLEKQIAECDNNVKVFEILNLIEEGKSSLGDTTQMERFISKAYYSYNGIMKFDKMTEAVATAPSEMLAINFVQVDENMVQGMLNKLKEHAISIISQPNSKKIKSTSPIVINNKNNYSAYANTNISVDISVSIKQARQQVEDAGLSDEQYKSVMDKLKEIKDIAKSKETKAKRWQKAKEVLKWVAEQGVAVAGILLPLLSPMIGA